ncbi:DNA-3-methyladenine glycosylase [Streptomyces sp. NPDC001876]|uniref:DNA-3-methyladenine glycosylase n=1 Tax=Streptomyces sp. NPDC001876 TaxID=3154402 RepID=UPI00331E29ED
MNEGMDRTPLTRDFFERPALDVAPDLLGRVLVRAGEDGPVELRLTEVEVPAGGIDPGSHALRGPTPRNSGVSGRSA